MYYWDKKINEWCEFFKLSPDYVKSKSRNADAKEARFFIMRYLYEKCHLSFCAIGNLLGDRDHSTVIHAKQKHHDLCDSDLDYKIRWFEFLKFVDGEKGSETQTKKGDLVGLKRNLIYKFENILRENKGKVINESLIEKFNLSEL